ncbi:LysE/ArgO family amino acid transporter [Kineococcus rhizosphaerae]|uniref:L-lysine exporter family protein LysE/ArgO n=1 Tax=Kineococcus rhizosphaerae TaxID=559628 RepID=A0A2T0R1F2_9ACTN|nr:LysE family transporter [Kineococcus rhizosphaerae]PRY13361.1 L-lysine exporter family protein LysE/ArgO [Kineococcus rhizosphaerae]
MLKLLKNPELEFTSAPTYRRDVLTLLSGLLFGLSLIVAIGAQNTFVIKQGVRGEHVGAVVAVCTASDVVLIGAGVAGAGALVEAAPAVLTVLRVAGALFLLAYGAFALRRAWRPGALQADASGAAAGVGQVVATAAALTWLNPHVYLDTVVLLGSVAAAHGGARWWFGAGAGLGSLLWFSALGYGARFLRPVFARPAAWRVLDLLVALVMVVLAVQLLRGA